MDMCNNNFRIYLGTPEREVTGCIYKNINGFVDLDSLNTVVDYSSQITVPPEYVNTYRMHTVVCHKIGKCVILTGHIVSIDGQNSIPNSIYIILPAEICNTVIPDGTYQHFVAYSKTDGSTVLGGILFLPSSNTVMFNNDDNSSNKLIRFFTVYTLK